MFQYKCDIFLSFKDNKFWKPSAVNDVRTKSFPVYFSLNRAYNMWTLAESGKEIDSKWGN